MLREDTTPDIRKWAMLGHLSAFAGLIHLPIPFGGIIAPAIIWILKGKEHPFIDEQCREAINFQISMTLYYVIAGVLCLLLVGFPGIVALFFAAMLFIPLFTFNVFCVVKGAMRSNDGYHYRYPLTIRLLDRSIEEF